MTTKDAIRQNMTMARLITNEYLSDLADAELVIRPVPGANHIAWQLGHLIQSMHHFLGLLGHAQGPLPAGFAEAHSKEASAREEPRGYLKKAEYLSLLERLTAGALAALNATADAGLDAPGPKETREYAPTVGSIFMLLGQHELMHSGQFAVLRRKLGKPIRM